MNASEKAQLEKELGLDKPIPVQYAAWIGGLLHGDLGYSYKSEKPALDDDKKLAASKTKLEILLNPDEDDTIELLKALQEIDKSCTEAEFEERSAKMTTIARRLLKREWVRIKTELK